MNIINMKNLTLLIRLILLVHLFLFAATIFARDFELTDQSVAEVVRAANVVYDSVSFQTGYMHIPPYIANGILSGCFDHMGFQSRPDKGIPNGRTVLGYIDHYYRHEPTTRQAQLPLRTSRRNLQMAAPF